MNWSGDLEIGSLTFLFVKLHVFYSETHHRHMSKIYLLSQNCSFFPEGIIWFWLCYGRRYQISQNERRIKHFPFKSLRSNTFLFLINIL